jgi:hypothetical protein
MSIFREDFLSRVKSRGASVKTQEPPTQSENAGHTGPLVLGPSRLSLKPFWREDAKWLEENYPEEFGASKAVRSPEGQGK